MQQICGLAFMADALEINLLYFLSVCAGDEFNLSDAEKAGLDGSLFSFISIGALKHWFFFLFGPSLLISHFSLC